MFGAICFIFYRGNFFFGEVGDSAKKYKMETFKLKPSKFWIFLAQYLSHLPIQVRFV
jgi:hypothetical protein